MQGFDCPDPLLESEIYARVSLSRGPDLPKTVFVGFASTIWEEVRGFKTPVDEHNNLTWCLWLFQWTKHLCLHRANWLPSGFSSSPEEGSHIEECGHCDHLFVSSQVGKFSRLQMKPGLYVSFSKENQVMLGDRKEQWSNWSSLLWKMYGNDAYCNQSSLCISFHFFGFLDHCCHAIQN